MANRDIDREIEAAEEVVERFEEADLPPGEPEPVAKLVRAVAPTVTDLSSDHANAEIFGMAALNPNEFVRYYAQDLAMENVANVFAQEFLIDMCHDDEDFVAFRAIRLVGEARLQRSVDDLVSLIGWPSDRLQQPQGKVGVGGATVLGTHLAVFGTDDVEELAALEDYYQENGHLPQDRLCSPYDHLRLNPDPEAPPVETPDPPEETPPGMVLVPGGTYTVGIERSELPVNRFAVGDFTEPYTVEIGPYFVDEYPVTNEEYDEFVAAVDDHDHRYCHPGEPDGKDHRRNTVHDDRVGPDHPVTGIDWYDAYAYAKWAGKDLPVDEEWEIAARGESGNVFPWGDTFDPSRLNWAGRAFDAEIDTWEDWQAVLRTADRMEPVPERMTTPVDAFPEGRSEFGVVDMVGNVWEYTKTNFYSRQEVFPVFEHKRRKAHTHLIEGVQAFPCMRGGAWSSIPEMTSAVYRSSDLMTDRHNEIGFRCVKRLT